jgi:peptide/nickel transport system substrate-binding protein
MKRLFFVIAATALVLPVSCSRPDKAANNMANAGGPPVTGDWMVVRLESDLDSLNQIISTSDPSSRVYYGANFSMIGEMLMQYDPKDWSFTKPLLAEARPEISDDHLTYTYTLRDGVQWHDGHPLTVDDFVFSVKAVMCPLVDSAAQRSGISDIANVEALEGRKIRYTMSKPNSMNDYYLGAIPVVPKHIYDPNGVLDAYSLKDIMGAPGHNDPKIRKFAEDFNSNPANRQAFGTGPYKFEKWDTGKEISVVRNPAYWGPKPYLDRIVYRIVKENAPALTALKAGDIDFNPRLAAIQYAEQTSGPTFDAQFQKRTYDVPVYYFLVWNELKPWFKDKRVRQAMTMLVDREQIIKTMRSGLATIGTSVFNPGSPDYNPDIKPWPYDPKRAAELLDEAGWKDTDGDGIRDKDGVPFRFEFLGTTSSTFVDQLMPVLKESFRQVGIDMTERRIDFTVFVESLKDKKFDAASSAWASDLVSDPYQILHSSSAEKRGSNYQSFKNAEVDKLIEDARREFDPEKRKQLYWRLAEVLHDEQPYTFLFWLKEAGAFSNRFQGTTFIPARPGYDLRAWFVPTAMQKYTNVPTN